MYSSSSPLTPPPCERVDSAPSSPASPPLSPRLHVSASRPSLQGPMYHGPWQHILHILRNRNPQDPPGALQLTAEEIRHPQQEYLLLAIRFDEDRVLLVKVAIRLRQLEGVPGHVGRLARIHRPLHRSIHLRSRQQHLPEIFAVELARHGR